MKRNFYEVKKVMGECVPLGNQILKSRERVELFSSIEQQVEVRTRLGYKIGGHFEGDWILRRTLENDEKRQLFFVSNNWVENNLEKVELKEYNVKFEVKGNIHKSFVARDHLEVDEMVSKFVSNLNIENFKIMEIKVDKYEDEAEMEDEE